MKQLAKLVFLSLICCFPGSHLLAGDNLSADEVRNLFTGNTAEGERREYEKAGAGSTGRLINFVEKFSTYYAEDGTVKQRIGEKLATGNWQVTDSGELCIGWEGKEAKCAPVSKEKELYKQVIKAKTGRPVAEIKYLKFTPGNIHDL